MPRSMTQPIATVALMVVTFAVSLWAYENEQVERRYIFRPDAILADKEYYRLITCAFLHAGWAHLLLNLYTLNSFGTLIEWQFGPWHLLLIYFGSVIGGSLLSLYLHRNHEYAAYGASGGVCGLIFASILSHPEQRLYIFPLPYAVPSCVFAILFLAGSFYALKRQTDNIGHDAHIGGAAIGLVMTGMLHPILVRQHWAVFLSLLTVAALIGLYVYKNPLFLPLNAFGNLATLWPRRAPARQSQPRARRIYHNSPGRIKPRPEQIQSPPSDWLLAEVEEHVGKLHRDPTHPQAWRDKFQRMYLRLDLCPASFAAASFQSLLAETLAEKAVRFVILDTSELRDDQLAQVRVMVANLPDDQFNRVIRSYALR